MIKARFWTCLVRLALQLIIIVLLRTERKGVTHAVRDLCFPAKGRKQTQEKMPFKSAWKLSVVQAKSTLYQNLHHKMIAKKWNSVRGWYSLSKKRPIELSPEYLDRLSQRGSKWIHEEGMFFFCRWIRNLEMDTWRSGCFWFYCIQNFRI